MLRQILLISSYEMMLQALNVSQPFIIFIVFLILTIILLYLLLKDDNEPNGDTGPVGNKLIEQIEFGHEKERRKNGGMAEILIVDDPTDKTNPQKKLAVKFYTKGNELAKYRATKEMENLRVLKHKNIVTYREHGFINHPDTNDKTRYLIMDFFDGYTIKELLSKHSNKKFPPLVIMEIGRQIIDALEYCHNKEIVHRDLTLANVLVDKRGQVCIIDFGNSTNVSSTVTDTIFDFAKHGTLNFLPPKSLEIDYASKKVDLYQLAVLMYAMYGGELFRGSLNWHNCEKAHQFIKDNITRSSIDIPPEISEILLGCLGGKYNDTSKLRAALGLPLPNDLAQMVQNIANLSRSQLPKLPQSRSDERLTDLAQDDEEETTRTAQNEDPED